MSEFDMYDILNRTRACIVELKTYREKLREIIKKPPENELQKDAIKTAKELLAKLNDILAALDRSN